MKACWCHQPWALLLGSGIVLVTILGTIHSSARADLHDFAEAYISREVEHPSSVKFQNEFQSTGKSIAICGQVTYRRTNTIR